MEQKIKLQRVGRNHLNITALGFGGASVGNLYEECSQEDALATITACYQKGIRYFDTAPEYGHGLSERRIGDALRSFDRDSYVLSTKVGEILYPRHNAFPSENKFANKLPFHLRFDYSYDGILRAFEDSLQRLGLHRIDIILVHDLDPIVHGVEGFTHHFQTYVESGYKALDELRGQGVIQAIGLGVKQWEVCHRAMEYGNYECFMLQGNYTLLEQPALNSFFDTCLHKNISIFQAGPYASGILATYPKPGAYYNHKEANSDILNQVQKIQKICDSYHVPIQAAALQFPLMHPAITSVVIGMRSVKQVLQSIEYAQWKIPQALWSALKANHIIPMNAPT